MALAATSLLVLGCGGGGSGGTDGSAADGASLSPEAQIGRLAFQDPTLSASGQIACVSCHAPATGGAAANDRVAQIGGARLDQEGLRASQPVRYLAHDTPFHFDAQGRANGGFFWDGRADSLAAQAAGPLLNPIEMANADAAAVAARIAQASWVRQFTDLYGDQIFDNPDQAFRQLTDAIARFELEDPQFNSYSSKYDAVLAGKASLTAQEARGLAIFNDRTKGNCAACHRSAPQSDGSPPLFTSFNYANLGVPRNPELKANADPSYFDLGLCGRPDLRSRTDLCGAFRVPSLRNVALRKSFFHNGRFKTLKDALTFYAQRDTNPEKFYPTLSDGTVDKFNDLPPALRSNVMTSFTPFNRHVGDAPALSDQDIDDLIAFLNTLTDGWQGGS